MSEPARLSLRLRGLGDYGLLGPVVAFDDKQAPVINISVRVLHAELYLALLTACFIRDTPLDFGIEDDASPPVDLVAQVFGLFMVPLPTGRVLTVTFAPTGEVPPAPGGMVA